MVLPSLFGLAVTAGGGYGLAYGGAALLAVAGALALLSPR